MGVVDELAGGGAGRGDTHPVHDVVKTGLEQEEEVLTPLSGHAGRLEVRVVELTLEQAVHVSDFLLLLQLEAVLALLLALGGQTMLSGRIVPLFEILVTAENRFAELTGDLGAGTGISCHGNLFLMG